MFIPKAVRPRDCSSFGLFVWVCLSYIIVCLFFFKLLIPYIGSLDKCHTSAFSALIWISFYVTDSSGLSQLTDVLQHIPASEGVYLLNTMTNMTESCSPSDLDLIETVTTSVFEVSPALIGFFFVRDRITSMLTLSQTSPGFYVSTVQIF